MRNSKYTKERFITLCIFLSFSLASSAQTHCDRIRPQWLSIPPKAGNSTYIFNTFRIQASNLSEAKRKLPDEAAYYMERSYSISGITVETTDVSNIYINGNKKSHTIETMTDTVITQAHKINLELRIIDEFCDRNVFHFLCAIPNPNTSKVAYNQMAITTNYGTRGLWRSAIVPGWGQMYKGSYLKGGLILGGAAALAGGAAVCSLTRKNCLSKMANTHSANVKQQYAARANNFNTGMYICLGSLVSLYVYNLVDATVAPGGKRIIVYPAVSSEGSIGAGGKVTF